MIAIDQYLEARRTVRATRHPFGIVHIVHGRRDPRRAGRPPRVRERHPCEPGDSIAVGSAVLTGGATPGHRPELLPGAVVVDVRAADAFDAGRLAAPSTCRSRRARSAPGETIRPGRRARVPLGRARPARRAQSARGRRLRLRRACGDRRSALRARLPQEVLRVDGGVADVLAALARPRVRLAAG